LIIIVTKLGWWISSEV